MSSNINLKTIIIAVFFSGILSTGIVLYVPQVQDALRGSQGEQGPQGEPGPQGKSYPQLGFWVCIGLSIVSVVVTIAQTIFKKV